MPPDTVRLSEELLRALPKKTTKRGDRMAFITLEDGGPSLEAIIFPSVYETARPCLIVGTAVVLRGKVNVDDDGEHFELSLIVSEVIPLNRTDAGVSGAVAADGAEYNVTGAGSYVPKQNSSEKNSDISRQTVVEKLFLRLPDLLCEKYKKTMNLLSIFTADSMQPGGVQVALYDSSEKKYLPYEGGRVMLSDVVLNELCSMLGRENVVLRRKVK